MCQFDISAAMRTLVEKANLRQKPRQAEGRRCADYKCPFCDDSGYHMNIDFQKGVFRCVRCGTGGGTLDLFGKLTDNEADNKQRYKDLQEFIDGARDWRTSKPQSKELRRNDDIPCAPDDVLDRTFSKFLCFPHFKLTGEHKENLLNRGLTEEDILKNGYKSISGDYSWLKKLNCAKEAFKYIQRDDVRKILASPELKDSTKEEIVAGLVVSGWLLEKGFQVKGVPGFYQLGERWAFRFRTPGILIPTRNPDGKIVAIQVRTSNPDLRYMTVSAKGLPGAVTVGISRIHFPVSNQDLGPNTKVLLTEGPLKADVALSLMHQMGMGEDIAFAAVQGVNNNRLLKKTFAQIKKTGCENVCICYDMDRVTNPFVAQATKSAKSLICDAGLNPSSIYWDEPGARAMIKSLYGIAVGNSMAEKADEYCGIAVGLYCDDKLALSSKDVLVALRKLAKFLYEHHAQGFDKKAWAWNSDNKGIDDELLSQLKNPDAL